MQSILLGLTRQYLYAVRLCSAPLWAAIILLLVGGPMLGQTLMRIAGGGEIDASAVPLNSMCVGGQVLATVFFALAAVVGLFQKPRYVFSLPVSSQVLAAWQFAAAGVTVVVSNIALIIAYQMLFDVSLPLASTLAMITATHLLLWLVWQFVPAMDAANTQRNSLFDASIRRQFLFMLIRLGRWLPLWGVFAFYVVFRLWYRESWLRGPVLWDQLTVMDVVVLLPVSYVAWVMVTREINAQRCGEVTYPNSNEPAAKPAMVVVASQKVPDAGTWKLDDAHEWFHWRAGRTLLVFGAIFVVPILGLIFAAIYADGGNRNKLEGGFAILEMMSVMGALLVGATLGLSIINPTSRKEMSKHVAVVPVTDQSLARTLLKTLVWTLSGVWGLLLAMCLLILVSYFWMNGVSNVLSELYRFKAFQELGYWVLPLALLGSAQLMWTTGGLSASLAWTGREQLFSIVTGALIAGGLLVFTVILFAVPLEYRGTCFTVVLALLAAFVVGMLAWSYARGTSQNLLQLKLVHFAILFWIVEGALVLMFLPAPLPVRVSVAGLIGLSVLPLTASPLAIAWNRHR